MKILIAGSSGAIGQPIVELLIEEGHEVFGITQSQERSLILAGKGANPVVLNILDRESVFETLDNLKPDVVIDMLTHLPKEYTPEAMAQAGEWDAKIRLEGGKNLQDAAEKCGVKRYIAQSAAFWYAPGAALADETVEFTQVAPAGISAGVKTYEAIEKRVLESKLEGVVLRFGFYYGPRTWFNPDGNMADQVRDQAFPVIGNGEGYWNFVHIDDAAKAVVKCLYCKPGIYNIVNDRPSKMKDWLPAFARFLEAKPPLHISVEEGLSERGADFTYYAEKLRPASNQKAKKEFDFQPRTFDWFEKNN